MSSPESGDIDKPRPLNCELRRDGHVLEIGIDRPKQRNALNYETVLELVQSLRAAETDPRVRVVLLYGKGPCFCAGGDLSEFDDNRGQTATEYHKSGAIWSELMTIIPSLRTPVIVAVHKYAMAGGMGIAAAGDILLASEDTQFALPEIRLGLFPAIVFSTVAAAVGGRAARELALTGRRIGADEARQLGLVHRVVGPDDLLTNARETAAEVASFGADVLALGKELMQNVLGAHVQTGTAYGKAMRGAFMETEEFRVGVERFLSRSDRARR